MLACVERFSIDAEERGNQFLLSLLGKQQVRLKGLFDRFIVSLFWLAEQFKVDFSPFKNEQIRDVEQTKLTSKKRRGVVRFIKHFPVYVGRVESQLVGADALEIRASVDGAYERIVQTMFESLKQMAKLDGEGEDKGQLNYHVIIIGMFHIIVESFRLTVCPENMHHFVAEISLIEVGSVAGFLRRAEVIYDENLSAYVKIVLRRPFAKLIVSASSANSQFGANNRKSDQDYFEGVERLLTTTAPTEVATNASYNKSALKKVVKEYNAKDIRKHVETLFKRVEKHFTEASEKTTTEESIGIAPGTVMVGVWKACEEELLRITDLFSKRISQCYADSGVTLDYTAADVQATFKRQRVGF